MVIGRRSLLLAGVAVPVAARGQCVTDTPSVDACLGGVRITQPPGATLNLSFFGPTLDPSLTFTRGSVATYFDATGTMQTVASGAPRFDYDPVTHAALGLLIEEQRINGLRNGNATGAIPGTPGTMPTNWAYVNTSGLTFTVVGSGTENGIAYTDLRVSGTSVNNIVRLVFETASGIAAATAQAWTQSLYVRLAAGTLTNVLSTVQEYQIFDASQTGLTPTGTYTNPIVITSAGLGTTRYPFTWTTAASSGTIAFIRNSLAINLTSTSAAVDFTLRIGGVQLEQGAFPTSYIPTTAAAVTRSGELCTAPLGAWYTQQLGTFATEAFQLANWNKAAQIVGANGAVNKTSNNITAGNLVTMYDNIAGVNSSLGAVPLGTPYKVAYGFSNGLQRGTVNGAVPITTSGTPMATGHTTLGVGNDTVAQQINGYIRRVRYWPRVLSNTELQSVTT